MKKIIIYTTVLFLFINFISAAQYNESPFTPEEIFSAIEKGFPGVAGPVEKIGDELTIFIRGERFYWAEGRILPEKLKSRWQEFDPYRFYRYPKKIKPVPTYSLIEKNKILTAAARMDRKPVNRHPAFFNTLWRAENHREAYDRVKTIYFLRRKVEIHRELLEDLAKVEEELLEKSKTDPALSAYIQRIGKLDGYNWRLISGTISYSYHSYGAAIDVIPYSYGGRQVYWRWAREFYPEWFSIPNAGRFVPPESFIEAFEKYGFIWGGKWLYFDTIHFEYRPDILILNGFAIEK